MKLYLIIILALIPLACTKTAPKPDEPVVVMNPTTLHITNEAMTNLKVATVEETDFPDVLSITGKISPTEDRTHVVPARATGRIEQVLISSGETVTAGQPLALIWSPDYLSAREEYIQSVRQDALMSKNADADNDFHSLAGLAKKKLESMGLSEKDVEELKVAATSVDTSDKTERFMVVRAPRGGAVINKSAILGNAVNLGDALFMIADLRQVWFLGDVYPEDLNKVKKNQDVVIDSQTPGGQKLTGKVSFISPIIDPSSRTIKIRALMNNPSLNLRADMYVQGNLILAQRRAILVPKQAILRDKDENYLFKISPLPTKTEGSSATLEAHKVKVSTVGERDGLVAIGEGVKPGEQIVVDGALLLNAALTNNGSDSE